MGFVNTKISESVPELTTQPTPLEAAISRFIFYLLVVILMVIVSTDLGEAQRNSTSVSDTLSSKADERFARVLEPMTLQFPRDHGGPIRSIKLSGGIIPATYRADDGKAFGYQLTFFRFALTPQMPKRTSHFATNQIYMGHFAVTDATNGEYFCFERRSRGAGGLGGSNRRLQHTKSGSKIGQPQRWSRGVIRLHVASVSDLIEIEPQIGLSLDLRQTRTPILHGDRGLSQKGPEPGNATYYYSLVGLETTGEVTVKGKTVAVNGISWMDHEFGTSFLGEGFVGWDWFSFAVRRWHYVGVILPAPVRSSV